MNNVNNMDKNIIFNHLFFNYIIISNNLNYLILYCKYIFFIYSILLNKCF